MKWMTMLACAAALATAPALAWAESTPEQRAAAKAEGDAMLAKAGAAAFFDNISDREGESGVTLQHKDSGLLCVFTPGREGNEVILFKPDGTDVGCRIVTFADSRTVYATKSDLTLDQAMGMAVTALKVRHPKAKPYRGKASQIVAMMQASGKLPPSRTERFIDGASYESVSVAAIAGWEIKMRMSGEAANAQFLANAGDGMGWLVYVVKAAQRHGLGPLAAAPAPGS
ncbi:hypothetical protein [Caulobacter endophyticus]|uniref:Uncharacterized protein n=1 Tax=Caulobacter endophyticus TaxID=2172652 RepID=A0A2T9JMI4_9CAUL|nr:hypothetical protein [Caulobacter endophyticus]PVM84878.1 hypothetical protein DDF67_18440 [Caulobacter endophyticus]